MHNFSPVMDPFGSGLTSASIIVLVLLLFQAALLLPPAEGHRVRSFNNSPSLGYWRQCYRPLLSFWYKIRLCRGDLTATIEACLFCITVEPQFFSLTLNAFCQPQVICVSNNLSFMIALLIKCFIVTKSIFANLAGNIFLYKWFLMQT